MFVLTPARSVGGHSDAHAQGQERGGQPEAQAERAVDELDTVPAFGHGDRTLALQVLAGSADLCAMTLGLALGPTGAARGGSHRLVGAGPRPRGGRDRRGGEPIRIFAVPDPQPRAWLVGRTRIADGEAAFSALLDPAFEPRVEAIVAS